MLTDAQAVSALHVNRGLVTQAMDVFGTFTLTQLARLHTNGSSSSGSWEYAEEEEEAERDEDKEAWYQAGPFPLFYCCFREDKEKKEPPKKSPHIKRLKVYYKCTLFFFARPLWQ